MASVVVGASQGLGEALCEIFQHQGLQVVAVARSRDKLQALQERVGCRTFSADVCDLEAMKQAMSFANQCYGGITTLIFCTGVNFDHLVADWEDTAGFRQVVDTNLTGAANALHAALPYLSASRHPHVVAITSLAGVIGMVPGGSAYAASKAGMDAMFSSFSPELRALGIKTLIVDPGSMWSSNSMRQVIGSGSHYRDARSQRKGRSVNEVAQEIFNYVQQGREGRVTSMFRLAVIGAWFLKLCCPRVLEKFALRVRFKQGGTLPCRVKHQPEDLENV